MMDASSDDCLVSAIELLMEKRAELRSRKEWALADQIRRRLEAEPYHVEISDFCDKPSSWTRLLPKIRKVTWSQIHNSDCNIRNKGDKNEVGTLKVPIVVATVDTPHYRNRLDRTLQHLIKPCRGDFKDARPACNCSFDPQPYNLLDLRKHPSLGTRRILIEGWRRILLPQLLDQASECAIIRCKGCEFILVAEDDIRLGDNVTARRVRDECAAVLVSNPDLQLLSLGHAWAAIRDDSDNNESKQEGSLYEHLSSGGGVHGTTLIALRYPQGVQRLRGTLETHKSKQTHLDQFLFFSELHELSLALCDRPLVGWAEVQSTLTKSGSGHRRQGGGRLAFVPSAATKPLRWVQRALVEKDSASEENT